MTYYAIKDTSTGRYFNRKDSDYFPDVWVMSSELRPTGLFRTEEDASNFIQNWSDTISIEKYGVVPVSVREIAPIESVDVEDIAGPDFSGLVIQLTTGETLINDSVDANGIIEMIKAINRSNPPYICLQKSLISLNNVAYIAVTDDIDIDFHDAFKEDQS